MDAFAILGFIFGIIAFTSVSAGNKKIKELEQRIQELEKKND
jgi:hypothetical protein